MGFEISDIQPEHDSVISEIIKQVGAEYGAIGEGIGPSDAEVAHMSHHFGEGTGSRYLVARIEGRFVGSCGVAAFGGRRETCELRRLLLLKESRGLGVGEALTNSCL